MKKVIVSAILYTLFIPALSQSNSTERELIENTIQLYFDGWATGDTTKLGKAMHASCHLKKLSGRKVYPVFEKRVSEFIQTPRKIEKYKHKDSCP